MCDNKELNKECKKEAFLPCLSHSRLLPISHTLLKHNCGSGRICGVGACWDMAAWKN